MVFSIFYKKMVLIFLLIIPILFWFVPLSRNQGIVKDELNRLIFNFIAMVTTCTFMGLLFWYFSFDLSVSLAVVIAISLAWAVVFHFVNNRLK